VGKVSDRFLLSATSSNETLIGLVLILFS